MPLPSKLLLRRRAAALAARAATRLHDHLTYVGIEHLPADPSPRFGHGSPPNPHLAAYLAGHEAAFAVTLKEILGLADDLARIPRDGPPPGEPHWRNGWIPGLDGAAIYAFLRTRRPARYLEVGSGISTLFASRAIRDGGLATELTSIDPHPRAEVDARCDRVVRQPLEQTDLGVFAELEAGDVCFIDNSHLALLGSDVVAFFLDVLPALAPGVLVGIHDVLLPSDYFPHWAPYQFSEQYVLAGWLLGGGRRMAPRLAAYHASCTPELTAVLDPLWQRPELEGVDRRGWAYWFEVTD